jgi:hypothetical protein
VKTGNLEESSKEGCDSKRAVLLPLLLLMIFICIDDLSD